MVGLRANPFLSNNKVAERWKRKMQSGESFTINLNSQEGTFPNVLSSQRNVHDDSDKPHPAGKM